MGVGRNFQQSYLWQISNLRKGPSLLNLCIPGREGLSDLQPTGKIVIIDCWNVNTRRDVKHSYNSVWLEFKIKTTTQISFHYFYWKKKKKRTSQNHTVPTAFSWKIPAAIKWHHMAGKWAWMKDQTFLAFPLQAQLKQRNGSVQTGGKTDEGVRAVKQESAKIFFL